MIVLRRVFGLVPQITVNASNVNMAPKGYPKCHSLELKVSQLENFGGVFFGNAFSSSVAREGVIVTDTRRQNILVESNYAKSVR